LQQNEVNEIFKNYHQPDQFEDDALSMRSFDSQKPRRSPLIEHNEKGGKPKASLFNKLSGYDSDEPGSAEKRIKNKRMSIDQNTSTAFSGRMGSTDGFLKNSKADLSLGDDSFSKS